MKFREIRRFYSCLKSIDGSPARFAFRKDTIYDLDHVCLLFEDDEGGFFCTGSIAEVIRQPENRIRLFYRGSGILFDPSEVTSISNLKIGETIYSRNTAEQGAAANP